MACSDPYILGVAKKPTQVVLQLRIPKELQYFEGHFDDASILPGVVQIHWAITLAQEHMVITGEFKSVDVVKFMKIIQPEDEVTLNLEFHPDKNLLHFSYAAAEKVCSTGKVRFK